MSDQITLERFGFKILIIFSLGPVIRIINDKLTYGQRLEEWLRVSIITFVPRQAPPRARQLRIIFPDPFDLPSVVLGAELAQSLSSQLEPFIQTINIYCCLALILD